MNIKALERLWWQGNDVVQGHAKACSSKSKEKGG